MNTYTRKIVKDAISQILGDMLTHTCKYGPESRGARDCTLEPDKSALPEFRWKLIAMAECLFNNEFNVLRDYIQNDVEPFIFKTGYQCGHINGNWSTGTWSVRLKEIDEILDLLDMPDIAEIFHKTGVIYDLPVRVVSVRVLTFGMSYKLESLKPGVNGFEMCLYWKEITESDAGKVGNLTLDN